VEVDQQRVNKELQKAAQKVASDYRIPGFRKGKAPYHIVVQMLGVQTLYSQFVDDLGQEVFKSALEQEGITPYATASLEEVKFDPLTYTVLVPMEPEVNLGDYRALRVDKDVAEVNEAEIATRLESYRDQHAGWQELSRPSQFGDMLNINVKSVIIPAEGESSAEETVVLDETDWDVTPDQENPMEPPGFDEALLGLAAGAEKEFVLGWPAESQSIYAGKSAQFQVQVNKIQAYEKPELNDAFAQLVGPDFATLDDLKANIRTTLEEQAKSNAENAYAEKVLNALVAQSALNYPPVVIEDQLDTMINEFEQTLRRIGIEGLEQYLKQVGGQTLPEYRERLRPEAQRLAEQNLVLSEVLRTEKLVISETEMEERIQTLVGSQQNASAEEATNLAEMFRSGSARPVIESQMLREKALQRLLDIAQGKEVPAPGEGDPQPETAVADDGVATAEQPAASEA
jgi:trigger factor